ncbi:MAG TPA: hypothetical protein GYA07_07675 [Verrucomicrobia bacterium]|nr:hypothetical protein [Verrucomicrobiota bacterium]HOB31464.1 hypothetical protein [Verrucomicrobiota bacterium]HOP98283.1 hypothetical protein [Verrucomicrobiota bacterium]
MTGVYHCPSDRRVAEWSYGLNVFYELGPDDDYAGKPRTWRRWSQIPQPTVTILFAENAGGADHIMPNFWITADDASDVNSKRHRNRANYTFVDGHSEPLPFEQTYAPPKVDLWNPLR